MASKNKKANSTKSAITPNNHAKKRAELSEQILRLSAVAVVGAAAETFRTCGNAGCRCHFEGPKHGPHMYVNFRRDGRQRGYYVPAKAVPRVRSAIAAWHEMIAALTELADLNRDQILDDARNEKLSAT